MSRPDCRPGTLHSSTAEQRAAQSEPFKISTGLCQQKGLLTIAPCHLWKSSLTIHDHKLNTRGDPVYKCFAHVQIRAHIV